MTQWNRIGLMEIVDGSFLDYAIYRDAYYYYCKTRNCRKRSLPKFACTQTHMNNIFVVLLYLDLTIITTFS